ncbi:MAG: ABC transporter permease, partial [Propionibacteriaceae bacterium]|nr:ABC transporter permease [Propionibacteriaceae bacterium]
MIQRLRSLWSRPNQPDPQEPDFEVSNEEGESAGSRWRFTFQQIATSQVLTVILSIFVALLFGAILIAAADANVQRTAEYIGARPGDFFAAVGQSIGKAYSALFQGAVFKFTATTAGDFFAPLTRTLANSVPLIFAGLALGLGFRTGLFNIGAQGQIILGASLCGFIGFTYALPSGLHIAFCVVGAFVGGALWAFIPGILKAKTGANEVIVTIMLNSIAVFLLSWLLTLKSFRVEGSNLPVSPVMNPSARFPHLFGTAVDLGFILALLAALAVWWIIERSTLGFRIRAVGENPNAARTAGMNVSMSYVWVMVIAGGLAGLASTSQLLSSPSQQLHIGVAGTFGFDAITVALLGRSKPFGIVLAGLLFG